MQWFGPVPERSPITQKLDKMFFDSAYLPPDAMDDLPTGIQLATIWLKDPYLQTTGTDQCTQYLKHLRMWIEDANKLLHPAPEFIGKLPPMNCVTCNHYNDYVGKEHLVDGVYKCRSCR